MRDIWNRPARRFRRARFGVAAFVFAALFAGSAVAQAQDFNYCGVLVYAGSWCGNNSVEHTYDADEVRVGGEPNFTEERMLFRNTNNVRYPGPLRFPGDYLSGCYARPGSTDFLFEAEARHRSGDPGVRHTVSGRAFYGTQSPTASFCQ